MTGVSDALKDVFWQALGLPNDRVVTVRHVLAMPMAMVEALARATFADPNLAAGSAWQLHGPTRVPLTPFMVGELTDPIREALAALDRLTAPPATPLLASPPPSVAAPASSAVAASDGPGLYPIQPRDSPLYAGAVCHAQFR